MVPIFTSILISPILPQRVFFFFFIYLDKVHMVPNSKATKMFMAEHLSFFLLAMQIAFGEEVS